MVVSPKSPLNAQPASAVSGVGVWAVSRRCAWVVSRAVSRWYVWAVSGVSRDFKQRQPGRRRERHRIRENPKSPLRMTGGEQVDVLR